ncbi:MAG: SCO family protein [Variovorax sp.]
MNRRDVVRALTASIGWSAVATTAGLALSACGEGGKKPIFTGIDITGAQYATSFSLKDADGQPRTLGDYKGKVVVLFFGYAQCPDACPTTMAELSQVKQKLGADANRLQVLFVTLDPARDTPEVMKAYVGAFDPSFVALIPEPDQLPGVAKDFKVFYKKVDGPTPTSYSMDHSVGSYVYDPQGRVRLYERYGVGADAVAADVEALLKQG